MTTRRLIHNLSEKVDNINPKKTDKPIPTSFLHKGKSVQIQRPVDRYPSLFPKEVEPKSPKYKVIIASLFHESEPETQVLPVYEPLVSQFTRYTA